MIRVPRALVWQVAYEQATGTSLAEIESIAKRAATQQYESVVNNFVVNSSSLVLVNQFSYPGFSDYSIDVNFDVVNSSAVVTIQIQWVDKSTGIARTSVLTGPDPISPSSKLIPTVFVSTSTNVSIYASSNPPGNLVINSIIKAR